MNKRTLIFIASIIIFIILAIFGGWFWYISNAQKVLDITSEGRGFGNELVGFPIGNTYSNIVGTIGSILNGESGIDELTKEQQAPRLWLAGATPVAGIAWTTTEAGAALRFMDMANGNIFDAYPKTSSVIRRTNTLKPQIAEAVLVGDSGVIARYPGEHGIESFYGTITTPTTTISSIGATDAQKLSATGPGTLSEEALPREIITITAKTDGSAIFYITPYKDGVAGYVAKNDGSKASRIWTSSLHEWNAEWTGDSILLVQKAAYGVVGNAYELSTNGNLSLLAGGILGLTAIKNHKGAVLYSTASEAEVALKGIGLKKGSVAPPFATFAEKCTWSTFKTSIVYCAVPKTFPINVSIPDAWYRGEINFSDTIWRFDTETGSVGLVYDPSSNNRSLDILNLTVSSDDAYLGFIDATTGHVWALRTTK